jgi:hypothetical protein
MVNPARCVPLHDGAGEIRVVLRVGRRVVIIGAGCTGPRRGVRDEAEDPEPTRASGVDDAVGGGPLERTALGLDRRPVDVDAEIRGPGRGDGVELASEVGLAEPEERRAVGESADGSTGGSGAVGRRSGRGPALTTVRGRTRDREQGREEQR